MSDRLDYLRSLVREAVDRLRGTTGSLPGLSAAREMIRVARARETFIDLPGLRACLIRGQGMSSLTLKAAPSGLQVQLTTTDGRELGLVISEPKTRFAPHGAKEISFRITPLDGQTSAPAGELVACLATGIAGRLWPGASRRRDDDIGPIVEREGEDRLRTDLRSVPGVRRMSKERSRALILEALSVRGLRFAKLGLFIAVGLPGLD